MAKFQAKPIFHIRFSHFKSLCSSIWPSWKVNFFHKIAVELFSEMYFDAFTQRQTLHIILRGYDTFVCISWCVRFYIFLYVLIIYNNKWCFQFKIIDAPIWNCSKEASLLNEIFTLLNLLQSKKASMLILRQVKSSTSSLKDLTKFLMQVGLVTC